MSLTPATPLLIGTREDPYGQEREARVLPLLLHSLSLFREVFEMVYAHHTISTVVEVGVESGEVSGIYAELGAKRVYCVDPRPSDDLRRLLAEHDALELVEAPSPGVLADLPVGDLYVLDGDHNYATVRGEVDWIMAHAPDAVVILHDVLWPCGRRDQYYSPSFLAPEEIHPHSADGATVWHEGLTPAGFVGAGAFTVAAEAGGERNGVLTAVEDALAAAAAEWKLVIVPAVFGVGVLVRRTPENQALLNALRPYTESRLLATLEYNRIALYTRVLQMQHDAVGAYEQSQRIAEVVDTQRAEVDRLTGETERLTADLINAERARELAQRELAEAADRSLTTFGAVTQGVARARRQFGRLTRRLTTKRR